MLDYHLQQKKPLRGRSLDRTCIVAVGVPRLRWFRPVALPVVLPAVALTMSPVALPAGCCWCLGIAQPRVVVPMFRTQCSRSF